MVLAIISWMAAIQVLGWLGLALILRNDRKPWEQYAGHAMYLVLTTWLLSQALSRFGLSELS